MTAPATVRVVSTNPASQGPFVLINAADFDPQRHTLYEPADASPAASEPASVNEPAAKPRRGRAPSTPTT